MAGWTAREIVSVTGADGRVGRDVCFQSSQRTSPMAVPGFRREHVCRDARGRKGGRPPGGFAKKREAALALRQDPKRSVQEICEILHISQATFYRYVKENEGQQVKTG